MPIYYFFWELFIVNKILKHLRQHSPLLILFCLWAFFHRNFLIFFALVIFLNKLIHFLQLIPSQSFLLCMYAHSYSAKYCQFNYLSQIEIGVFFMNLICDPYMKNLALKIFLILFIFILMRSLIWLGYPFSIIIFKFSNFILWFTYLICLFNAFRFSVVIYSFRVIIYVEEILLFLFALL